MTGTKDQKPTAVTLVQSVETVGMPLVEFAESNEIVVGGSRPRPRPTPIDDINVKVFAEAAAVALATLQQSMAGSTGRVFANAVHNQLTVDTASQAAATRSCAHLLTQASAQARICSSRVDGSTLDGLLLLVAQAIVRST